jgi:hypothetical protein
MAWSLGTGGYALRFVTCQHVVEALIASLDGYGGSVTAPPKIELSIT